MIIALRVQRVGKLASGKIGIASSDQCQVASEASVGVESAVGFDRGAEFIVWSDQRQSCRSCEQFSVGRRREQLGRISGIEHLAGRERDYFDAPEPTGQVGGDENRSNSFFEGFVRGSVQLRQ